MECRMSSDHEKTTCAVRCPHCREIMPTEHDCDLAREARALFEAAKRANDPASVRALADRAYAMAEDAENV